MMATAAFRLTTTVANANHENIYLLSFKIEVACYFAEHAPVDPVRMTYSNGYQNARTGVGSVVVVFIRPCGCGGRSCLGLKTTLDYSQTCAGHALV